MEKVRATVKPGYRVGSGTSTIDPTFNEDGGTIRLQIPEFKIRGLDFDAYFEGNADETYICGTLGLYLAPQKVVILAPEYHFIGVRWTHKFDKPGQPPFLENFYLSPAAVTFRDKTYKALLYIPDPVTKPAHFHTPTTLEVIAQKIPTIQYGDEVILEYNPKAVQITIGLSYHN